MRILSYRSHFQEIRLNELWPSMCLWTDTQNYFNVLSISVERVYCIYIKKVFFHKNISFVQVKLMIQVLFLLSAIHISFIQFHSKLKNTLLSIDPLYYLIFYS